MSVLEGAGEVKCFSSELDCLREMFAYTMLTTPPEDLKFYTSCCVPSVFS